MYLLSSGGENYFFNKLLFTLYIRLLARRREVVLLRIRRVWHKQHNQIEQCAKNFFYTDSLLSTYFKAKVGKNKITQYNILHMPKSITVLKGNAVISHSKSTVAQNFSHPSFH